MRLLSLARAYVAIYDEEKEPPQGVIAREQRIVGIKADA